MSRRSKALGCVVCRVFCSFPLQHRVGWLSHLPRWTPCAGAFPPQWRTLLCLPSPRHPPSPLPPILTSLSFKLSHARKVVQKRVNFERIRDNKFVDLSRCSVTGCGDLGCSSRAGHRRVGGSLLDVAELTCRFAAGASHSGPLAHTGWVRQGVGGQVVTQLVKVSRWCWSSLLPPT